MSQSRDPLVWLDMEMTGLDPQSCVPLQVGLAVTGPDLEELDHLEVTIWQPESVLESMEPVVRKMHTENGLIEKVRGSDVSLADAERKVLGVLHRWCKPTEAVLAGSCIHQDRRFLARYFPAVNAYLHYRMVDVFTIRELVQRWYGSDGLF